MSEILCSESSSNAQEPVQGSAAPQKWRWLALEYRARWEAQAVATARFSPEVRAWLDRFQALPGARVQLIRRTRRAGPLACFFADTTPNAGWVRSTRLDRYEDLLAFEPEDLLTDQAPLQPHEGPLVWICTHGQRDHCCAKFGGRFYAALRAQLGDAVWQTSHIGGHRFAATLLVVPSGLCYGRLLTAEAPDFAQAVREGRLFRLDRVRGRVAWSPQAQVAEIALRQLTDDRGPLSPTLIEESSDRVTFEHQGRLHRFELQVTPNVAPIIASCGQPPAPRESLVARRV